MFEEIAVWVIVAGLLLVVSGYLWMVARAFHTRLWWGFFVLILFGWIPFLLKHRGRAVVPSFVVLIGLVMAGAPVAYTKIRPVDLGPLLRSVEGEKHITLTGWDRKDYGVLASHPDVVVLQMANPDVTDTTMDTVTHLVKLRELDLSDSAVTDTGLAKLVTLKQLKTLKIRGTQVSDAGLTAVADALPELMAVDARQTKVTGDAANTWKSSKPGRKIMK